MAAAMSAMPVASAATFSGVSPFLTMSATASATRARPPAMSPTAAATGPNRRYRPLAAMTMPESTAPRASMDMPFSTTSLMPTTIMPRPATTAAIPAATGPNAR